MRKIKNPYTKRKNYNCFACSPDNSVGLQMEFYENGDEIISAWVPDKKFEGYYNILHGGIQSTLMDEIASWAVQVKIKTAGVTFKMGVTLKKPVYITNNKIHLKAVIGKQVKNFVTVHVDLMDDQKNLCATGEIIYYIFPDKIAREQFHYPGHEIFFE